MTNSRISGFYNMTLDERRPKLEEATAASLTSRKPAPIDHGRTLP